MQNGAREGLPINSQSLVDQTSFRSVWSKKMTWTGSAEETGPSGVCGLGINWVSKVGRSMQTVASWVAGSTNKPKRARQVLLHGGATGGGFG